MTAVAWTAIGLLAATLFGTLFYLGQRLDGLAARIETQGAQLNERLDGLAARIDGQGGQLNDRIDALAARLDSRIDGLSSMLQEHLGRHAG